MKVLLPLLCSHPLGKVKVVLPIFEQIVLFLIGKRLESVVKRLLQSVLEIAHLEYALGFDSLLSLLEEAAFPPFVNNQTLLDDIEEIFILVLVLIYEEHFSILEEFFFGLLILQIGILQDVPLESLVEGDDSVSGLVIDSLAFLNRDLLFFLLFGPACPTPIVIE